MKVTTRPAVNIIPLQHHKVKPSSLLQTPIASPILGVPKEDQTETMLGGVLLALSASLAAAAEFDFTVKVFLVFF